MFLIASQILVVFAGLVFGLALASAWVYLLEFELLELSLLASLGEIVTNGYCSIL